MAKILLKLGMIENIARVTYEYKCCSNHVRLPHTMSARQIADKFKFHAVNLMIMHNSGIYETFEGYTSKSITPKEKISRLITHKAANRGQTSTTRSDVHRRSRP